MNSVSNHSAANFDYLETLPNETLEGLMSILPQEVTMRLGITCKRIYDVAASVLVRDSKKNEGEFASLLVAHTINPFTDLASLTNAMEALKGWEKNFKILHALDDRPLVIDDMMLMQGCMNRLAEYSEATVRNNPVYIANQQILHMMNMRM